MIDFILYVVAFICFIVAAFASYVGVGANPRINLVALGLAAWVLVAVLGNLPS